MNKKQPPLLKRFCFGAVAILSMLVVTSCATQPQQPDAGGGVITKKELSQQADILLQIEGALAEKNAAKVERLIARLDVDKLNNNQKILRQATIAEYYLIRNRPKRSLVAMQAVKDPFLIQTSRPTQIKWFSVYADVLAANNDRKTALRLRLFVDERLSLKERTPNQQAMFALAEKMSMRELLKEAAKAPDLYMRGWYDFFVLQDIFLQYGRIDAQKLWQQVYRRHPAQRYLETTPRARRVSGERFQRVAFLLPFSEVLAPYSNAIYQGYIDAAGENRITVEANRYNTEEDIPIDELTREITQNNYQAIIGPLRPSVIEQFAKTNYPKNAPIVLLNELPLQMRQEENVRSIALTLEDSVSFAADMAYEDGCRLNLLIAEDTSQGDRMRNTLEAIWDGQEDSLLVKSVILSEDTPISQQVSEFLEVDNSEVDATKDIFRRYLLILSKLGKNEAAISRAFSQREDSVQISDTSPQETKLLLVSAQELARLLNDQYQTQALTTTINATAINSIELELTEEEDLSQWTPEELLIKFRNDMQAAYSRVEAECIFLATDRATASMLRPFLSFYLANDMQVYGTFLLYDSRPDSSLYADLNQVYYGEMPGVTNALNQNISELPAQDAYGLRFYALGRDIFSVLSIREQETEQRTLNKMPTSIIGESGILTLNNQEIRFLMSPVVFKRGKPVPRARKSIFQ